MRKFSVMVAVLAALFLGSSIASACYKKPKCTWKSCVCKCYKKSNCNTQCRKQKCKCGETCKVVKKCKIYKYCKMVKKCKYVNKCKMVKVKVKCKELFLIANLSPIQVIRLRMGVPRIGELSLVL